MPLNDPKREILFLDTKFNIKRLLALSNDDLLTLRNLVSDNLDYKRRRKIVDRSKIEVETWKLLCIFDGDKIDMADEEKTPKPAPKCYSAEIVKRPTRKMFMRIKKVGEPDKSQRPFAWGDFKNGMRLIDIKEDPDLHAGKISFWGRQKPPLIEMTDISDQVFAKELDAWYVKHGLTNPDADKKAKAEAREKAKTERAKTVADAKAKREADKATKAKAREEATAKKKADGDAKKKLRDEAAAKRKVETEAKKKAKAAAAAKPKAAPAPGKKAPAA